MKVMVTGGSGNIGSKLIPYLTNLGHECFNYDRNVGYHLEDTQALKSVVEEFQPEVIVHLAAIATVFGKPIDILDNNVENGLKIASLGIRTIFASSVAAKHLDNTYGCSKKVCEPLFWCSFRFSNIYGISTASGVIDAWANRLKQGLNSCLYTDSVRNFVHYLDICEHIHQAILDIDFVKKHGKGSNIVYITGDNHNIKKLAKKYFKLPIEKMLDPTETRVSSFRKTVKYCGMTVDAYLQSAKFEGDYKLRCVE